MENNDLKKLWAQLDRDDQQNRKTLDVDRILQQKSQSVVDRFLRNAKIEILMVWIMLPVLVLMAIYASMIRWMMVFAIAISIYELLLFYNLLRKMKTLSPGDSLKGYLEGVLVVFQGFNLHYKILAAVAIPFGYLWGVFIYGRGEFIIDSFTIIFLTTGVVITLAILFFWMGGLYGKKIKTLKKMIADIEREEEAVGA
ncbi:MAG: hypothetical protein ACEPOZ_03145 [Marinifilaceae bacterium]